MNLSRIAKNALTRVSLVGFTGALFLSGCVEYKYTPLTDALVIHFAGRAATNAGFHLADFEPVPVFALEGKKWKVVYQGKTPPANHDGLAEPKAGHHLLVWLDNRTGAGQVVPGQ